VRLNGRPLTLLTERRPLLDQDLRVAPAGGDLALDWCDPTSAAVPAGWAECVRDAGLHQFWDWRVVHTVTAERGGGVVAGMLRDDRRVVGLVTGRLHTPLRRHPMGGVADVEHLANGALPGIGLPGPLPGSLNPDGPPDPDLLPAAVRAVEAALRARFGRRLQAVAFRQIYAGELPAVQRGTTLVREGKSVGVLVNRFADYEDYLRSLSRSRRQDQRRLVRVIDADPELKVTFGPRAESGLDLDEFWRLTADVSRRNHLERWPPRRIWSRTLLDTLTALPDVQILTYTTPGADRRLVAATALFDHPIAPALGPWGAPPLGDGRRSGLWFDHFARQLRWMIDGGRRAVLAGKGAQEAKEALGFTFHPQWTVLRRLRG